MRDLTSLLSGSAAEIRTAAAEFDESELREATLALVEMIGDEKCELMPRLGVGRALSVLGDPRIDPLQPGMVLVPGGAFPMGMALHEVDAVAREFDLPKEWLTKACPRHEAELDTFEIGRFPVTQLEWAAFVAATGQPELPPQWTSPRPPDDRANHPVHGISPQAVAAYCQWLSATSGLRYRLPTEAEWERAARGTDARAYPWGPAFDPRRANTRETGIGDTTPVGFFPQGASPCGALDMAGNVEELTGSLYRLYPGALIEDSEEGTYLVSRGGCYGLDGDLARCDRRHGLPFAGAVGFRLARSRAEIEPPGEETQK